MSEALDVKFKVKLRISSESAATGATRDKVSFHLEEGTPFILGRATAGMPLQHASVAEKHCSLVVEDGELFVNDLSRESGGDFETKLNNQKVRSRVVHIGDILEMGSVQIEFLEVPFKQPDENASQTQFLDLSAAQAAVTKPAPKALPTAAAVVEKTPVASAKAVAPTKAFAAKVEDARDESGERDPRDEQEEVRQAAPAKKLSRSQRRKLQRAQKAKVTKGTDEDLTEDDFESESNSVESGKTANSARAASAQTLPEKRPEPFNGPRDDQTRMSSGSLKKPASNSGVSVGSVSLKKVAAPVSEELAEEDHEDIRESDDELSDLPTQVRKFDDVYPDRGANVGDGPTGFTETTKWMKHQWRSRTGVQIGIGAAVPVLGFLVFQMLAGGRSAHVKPSDTPPALRAPAAVTETTLAVPEVETNGAPLYSQGLPSLANGDSAPANESAEAPRVGEASAPVLAEAPAPLTPPTTENLTAPVGFDAKTQRVIEREQRAYNRRPIAKAPVKPAPLKSLAQAPMRNRGAELVEAAGIGDLRRVQSLLFEERIDPNSRTLFGETAIMAAAAKGQLAVVRLLIDKGADVNAIDSEGSTAVMRAVTGGHQKIVAFLVLNGASTRARNKRGDTALSLARRWARQDILQYLQGDTPARTPASKKRR